MATQLIRGWGGHGRWRWHTDDADPLLRAKGWGGGSQWKAHCDPDEEPLSGNTGGMAYKLFCVTGVQPPP